MCLGMIGRVERRWDAGGMPMAAVSLDTGEAAVCLLYEPEAAIGEQVLVQFGFVIERLDDARAADAVALRSSLTSRNE